MIDRNLTPIVNIFQKDTDVCLYACSYRKFEIQGGSSKQLHKAKLGNQTCTWQGSEFRFWVWDFPEYRVMVSHRGVEFEVDSKCSVRKAWKFWREYCERLGIQT